MDAQATVEIPRAFLNMPDPRRNNSSHRVFDVLTIALFAVICGADDWPTVVMYGRAKIDWLKTFLELPTAFPRMTPSAGSPVRQGQGNYCQGA